MEDNDKEQLRKGQKVPRTTKISIKKNDGKDLWPLKGGGSNEKLDIILDTRRDGRLVIVNITELPSYQRNGTLYTGYGGGTLGELTCKKDDLVISGEGVKKVYGEQMRGSGVGKWRRNNDGSIGLGMSLGECKTIEKEKIECSLKSHK